MNLGFNRGAELADPDGILQGTGKLIRHVRAPAGGPPDPSWLDYVERARDLAVQRLLARGEEPTPGTSLIKRVRKGG